VEGQHEVWPVYTGNIQNLLLQGQHLVRRLTGRLTPSTPTQLTHPQMRPGLMQGLAGASLQDAIPKITNLKKLNIQYYKPSYPSMVK
jgi:hypothetical protein